GKRTINKYGCFGCHDIPGFEDAKPIGTGLADWGRKDPSKLAFEHITHYIEHGHGHAAGHSSSAGGHDSELRGSANPASSPALAHPAERGAPTQPVTSAEVAQDEESLEARERSDYYTHQIEHGSRIGFLWQKLKEPRSYDYEKTQNKR